MIISLVLILASLMIFFSFKEQFDNKSNTFKYSVIGALTIVIASVLTMEFFIYLHQRILEFFQVLEKIPAIFVIFVLMGLIYGVWKFLFSLAKFKKEDFRKFIQETFIPKAKESIKEIKETGKVGLKGLKEIFLRNPFKKKKIKAEPNVEKSEEFEEKRDLKP